MSTELFPIIQPRAAYVDTTLPLYREVKWDYTTNVPVFRGGSPVIITGRDAVAVWVWKALNTVRYRHVIYTWNYGNEIEQLIGQPFTDELKRSEAVRYVRDCLRINPYVKDVFDIAVTFGDGTLSITGRLITVYGEVSINV